VSSQKPGHRKPARRKGLIFVISGPSGSGKTTLASRILKDGGLKKIVAKSVSLTTRPKRSGEASGRDYFLLTEKEFQSQRKAGKILEWTRYLGHYYGTPKDFVDKQIRRGRSLILCLDLKGARRIKRLYPDRAVTIFISPPGLQALRQRLEKRCNKTRAEEIQNRLRLARKEITASRHYDHCLVNKDLLKSLERLRGIITKRINASP
jgi:guanylate kinase